MNESELKIKTEEIKSLPIFSHLEEICENLSKSESRFLVINAETAAGKSTALPLALLTKFDGKIMMVEPRRLAATAIADRLSYLIGEKTGETIGYRLHLDSKISSKTRLEVVTEAILIRKMQSDPSLEDVNVIVLDEFHERSIYSDMALAFLKEIMELRDDLYVVVMSATMNLGKLTEYLKLTNGSSNNKSVMKISGRKFLVDLIYDDKNSLKNIIFNELEKLAEKQETILVFLPGIYEIQKCKRELEEELNEEEAEILILHSSVSMEEQRKVLSPNTSKIPRIILSSAIAETSLTVPDVTVVIDRGFSRAKKFNVSLGMEQLITEKESLFSADQRSGRAGRVKSGRCIRMWNKNDVRVESRTPEILRCDLSQLLLECLNWGVSDVNRIEWLDCPSMNSIQLAEELLEDLNCIKDKKITEFGRNVLLLGLNPRLGSVALAGYEAGRTEEALEICLEYSEYKKANVENQRKFKENLKKRLNRIKVKEKRSYYSENLLIEGFPDRIANLVETDRDFASYQFTSGRKASLKMELLHSKKENKYAEWIICPEVDAGETIGKIYSYEILNEKDVNDLLNKRTLVKYRYDFDDSCDIGKIKKFRQVCIGRLVIKESAVQLEESDFKKILCERVKKSGLEILPSNEKIEKFLPRVSFYIQNAGTIEEKKKFETLAFDCEQWLLPFLNGSQLKADMVYDALYWYLNGENIDKQVPEMIELPNGRKKKVKYEKYTDGKIKPVIEIIIQQIFGCYRTPEILGVPILMKLLSPASRPLQITEDLENFWKNTWPEICKEMKGRYPKHNWNYQIIEE